MQELSQQGDGLPLQHSGAATSHRPVDSTGEEPWLLNPWFAGTEQPATSAFSTPFPLGDEEDGAEEQQQALPHAIMPLSTAEPPLCFSSNSAVPGQAWLESVAHPVFLDPAPGCGRQRLESFPAALASPVQQSSSCAVCPDLSAEQHPLPQAGPVAPGGPESSLAPCPHGLTSPQELPGLSLQQESSQVPFSSSACPSDSPQQAVMRHSAGSGAELGAALSGQHCFGGPQQPEPHAILAQCIESCLLTGLVSVVFCGLMENLSNRFCIFEYLSN